jgi:alkanesulfonate monooxygenase SsuD/methylene tetrahydromethanopterin reductase-like flavin-dependent oxidoreductase (luciferase family)
MKDMKIGLQLGYWGAGPPPNAVELVLEADRLGYDSVWTAESYGSDALTPLAWWGSRTERVRLGTVAVPAVGPHPDGHGHGRP